MAKHPRNKSAVLFSKNSSRTMRRLRLATLETLEARITPVVYTWTVRRLTSGPIRATGAAASLRDQWYRRPHLPQRIAPLEQERHHRRNVQFDRDRCVGDLHRQGPRAELRHHGTFTSGTSLQSNITLTGPETFQSASSDPDGLDLSVRSIPGPELFLTIVAAPGRPPRGSD